MTTERPDLGTIGWIDLTIDDAETIRDFYRDVVGWKPEPVDMGSYEDFSMVAAGSGEAVAGVCHARGGNADLPPAWIPYFIVDDVDASAAACVDRGGAVVIEPQGNPASGRYCVIRDPAGAVAALYAKSG